MSLEFLTGSSGAGKSYTVYREVIEESMAHPEKQYLVIVPEQFTMQTQKEIVRMHPRHGLLNVDVLSFHRLAWRVFGEVGGNTLPVLDETGKTLIVQRVIASRQKDLKVLGRALSRQGAAARMKSLISELLQYGVTEEDLENWQEDQGEGLLAGKLEDIRMIYGTFREYLENTYQTAEELPEVLCGVIGKSELIRGSVIVFDGFTGFTPLQYKVLRELLILAEKVTVPVTLDPSEDPLRRGSAHELFHMSREMIRHCKELADETHTEVLSPRKIEAGEHSRFAGNEELQFLEQHLFRYKKAEFAGNGSRLHLYEASDPHQELQHAAAEIVRRVREDPAARYRDFALVTGDLATYGDEAEEIFRAAGIPCYLDQKRPVLTNPLVEGIRAALQMEAENYSYDAVFRFLRSGMTGFTRDEIDRMENYALALGIRGRKRYEEPWIRLPEYLKKGRKEAEPQKDGEVPAVPEILALNELRERFAASTQEFHDRLHDRKGSIRTKTEALYGFLLQHRAQEKTEQMQKELQEAGEPVRAAEYAQIYAVVMDLLDKIVEVLGEEKAGIRAYAEILDAAFAELRVGTIPPGEDQVLIGDMERTRLKEIRTLFFVGVNEGVVPRPVQTGGILSEMDRETLKKAKASLAPTAREEICQQRFYLYLAMTKPSDELFLSWSRSGKGGESLLPAGLIGTVRRLFPNLETEFGKDKPEIAEAMETDAGQKQMLLGALQNLQTQEISGSVKELILWMQSRPGGEEGLRRLLTAAAMQKPESGIGKLLAEQLYGKELYNSATRLERFAGCAFAHFCQYGLRLQEREVYAFTPADLGTVMHRALEIYSRILQEEGRSWNGLSEEDRNACADRALEAAVGGSGKDILYDSGRGRYVTGQMRDVLYQTVWALQTQIEHGDFTPADFEFSFYDDLSSASFRLQDGAAMKLGGRIDRLDLCEADGRRYVKIIDYKTGSTAFDMNKLYYGLQLQLVLYMNAAIESEQKKHPGDKVEPAGIFYYHVDDPMIESDTEKTEAQQREEILRLLRPDGRCRAEEEILGLLDHDLQKGASRSAVIPVERKKDGGFKVGSKVADGGTFSLMQEYAAEKAKTLGSEILEGRTEADPYLYGDTGSCTWCSYHDVCGFDERLPGYEYRRIYKRTDDDLYPMIQRQLESMKEE